MKYKIAEILLSSEVTLPSFAAFACAEGEPDVCLTLTDRQPPEGKEVISANITHRRLPDGWYVCFRGRPQNGLYISEDYTDLRLLRSTGGDGTPAEEHFVRLALECLLALRGYVSIHGACVALNGSAVLFTAPSGVGKSTRAQAWQKAFGAELISGDRPLIDVRTLRVYGVPWDGKEKCYNNTSAALQGIYEVRRSTEPYLRRLTDKQKRRLLFSQCFLPMWDSQTAAIQMINLQRLMKNAQITRVFCGPDIDDARKMCMIMNENTVKQEATDMKIKEGFILREIVGEYMVMPTGDNIGQYNGTIVLNAISALVWKLLENPVSREDLLTAILNEYDVEEAVAAKDLDELLEKLKSFDVLEEE